MKRDEVKRLLSELGIKPLKSLGQNFLIDDNVVHKICSFKDVTTYSHIYEIGPGLGSLTSNMEAVKDKLTLIELDRTLAAYWLDKGFDVSHSDALKFDWSAVPVNSMLISNLPYQISSRLLMELFMTPNHLDSMVLMFQKEVGERIRALPEDKKTYGLLSIICALFWDVRTVVKAPGQCFYPPPEIESVVLNFEKKSFPAEINRKAFVNHLKVLFAARRKKIGGSFKKVKSELNEKALSFMDLRPDALNPQEHLELFMEIYS
jgi:16S rRNA (adenine1518-N6/adenine1519-N6)-dimethyltransferase